MEATKEPQRGRELGGHDGDDGDDGDDRVGMILAQLTMSAQILAACTTARLNGISFEAIRNMFEAQLALVITTENAISAGASKEETIQAVEKTASILTQNVYAKTDDDKDRS